MLKLIEEAWKQDRLHHAYLIIESYGGDAQKALTPIFQALACIRPQNLKACKQCESCKKLQHGTHAFVHKLLPNEKGLHAIESIRTLSTDLHRLAPKGQKKLIWIENAEGMNIASQNALLKTLEDPPGQSIFFLSTANPAALLDTIRSRTLPIKLPLPSLEESAQHLEAQGIEKRFARALAELVGPNEKIAAQWLENDDFVNVGKSIKDALNPTSKPTTVIEQAALLSQTPERYNMALQIFEWLLKRDLIALGNDKLGQYFTKESSQQTFKIIQKQRKEAYLNPNKTLCIELLFFHARGELAYAVAR